MAKRQVSLRIEGNVLHDLKEECNFTGLNLSQLIGKYIVDVKQGKNEEKKGVGNAKDNKR